MAQYEWLRALGMAAAIFAASPAQAELDLKRAEVSRLPNGLTVILLEDHSFPVVSVQALYKSGARDETAGKTGLAHFLEHLAFRASENFPNAGATEAIYDAGGEWHGYTWLDQTTYYSTMPANGLDLLFRIEADRMARVTIDDASIAAEKGAVITEMHSYENDPSSVLLDAVTATALQAHPYRNNTIGYESDVVALTAEDARAFYATHYAPANAVLTIVGDVSPAQAKALVARYFGTLPTRASPKRVAAIEPLQKGERRTTLLGPVDRQFFEIAYPAPAASSPDFPAFLVLQQILSGGSGVNFHQNDWGTPAAQGSLLHGASADIATWFIPTADRFIFTVKGSIEPGSDQLRLERELEKRMAPLRGGPPTDAQLTAAKTAASEQLVEDVATTEDAAHQLAFFEGIGAYDMLVGLPEWVRQVTGADVHRVAQAYLQPQMRTIGWYVPGNPPTAHGQSAAAPAPATARRGAPPNKGAAPQVQTGKLSGGIPAIVQANPLSPTASVELLLTAPVKDGEQPQDLPGFGTITRSGAAADLASLIADAATALASGSVKLEPRSDDPETRLEQLIDAEIGTPASVGPAKIVSAVVSGDVDPTASFAALEKSFGSAVPVQPGQTRPSSPQAAPRAIRIKIDRMLSQGALGYVVTGPPPGTRDGQVWRMLLYILTHDYSGRLGRSAITDKGLVYHIYSSYRTDGPSGWAVLTTGVDPRSADAMEAELKAQLARLATEPPSAAEVEAARRHLLGRDLSSAQSNEEITARLIRQFVETGGLRSHDQLKAMLDTISPADVAAAAPDFARGTILRVDVNGR
jgi:zinc protease